MNRRARPRTPLGLGWKIAGFVMLVPTFVVVAVVRLLAGRPANLTEYLRNAARACLWLAAIPLASSWAIRDAGQAAQIPKDRREHEPKEER